MSRRLLCVMLLVCLAWLLAAPVAAQGKPAPLQSSAVTLENAHIKILVPASGNIVLGTTGGDPAIGGDNNKSLLYGYPLAANTSYASLRVIRDGITTDFKLYDTPTSQAPQKQGEWIVTKWRHSDVEITQQARILFNPYTVRDDLMEVRFTLKNEGATAAQAGVRLELDIQVGLNDSAPFFLPGVGRVGTEVEFSAGDMPQYYKGFESSTFAADSLRSMAILRGFGMTTPDRLVIATYLLGRGGGQGISTHVWDYAITPNASLGDSATAVYFGPRQLGPGQSFTVRTSYGLGGAGGGDAWIEAPAELDCETASFSANLWVANNRVELPETLFNGRATLTLPPGLSLAPGQNAQVSLGDIIPGDVRSVVWELQVPAGVEATYPLAVVVYFDNLDEPLRPAASVHMAPCAPTPTPTLGPSPTPPPPTATPTPGPTPTPVPQPSPTATPPPAVPEPGSLWLLATGLSGLAGSWALRRRRR